MSKHSEMIRSLLENPRPLQKALNLPDIWIRQVEAPFGVNERADMIFHDGFYTRDGCVLSPPQNWKCYVLELKSDVADHEVVGQLKKAVDAFEAVGRSTNHWNHVVGVAVAPEYTSSGLALLKQFGYHALVWSEFQGKITLRNTLRLLE